MVLRVRFCVGKHQSGDGVLPESKQSPAPKRIRFLLGGHDKNSGAEKKIKKKKRQRSMITAADDDEGFMNPTGRPLKLRVVFKGRPRVHQPPRRSYADDFGMTSGCSFEDVGPALVPPPPFHLCLLSQGQFSDSVTDVYDDDNTRMESESVNQEWGRRPTYRNGYYSSDCRRFHRREERFDWTTAANDHDETESVGDNFDL